MTAGAKLDMPPAQSPPPPPQCTVTTEVDQEAATEEPSVARNVPCPLSEQEIQHGWNTLMNKCWLQCADCNRWRNVPEEVRDKVRVGYIHASHASP